MKVSLHDGKNAIQHGTVRFRIFLPFEKNKDQLFKKQIHNFIAYLLTEVQMLPFKLTKKVSILRILPTMSTFSSDF